MGKLSGWVSVLLPALSQDHSGGADRGTAASFQGDWGDLKHGGPVLQESLLCDSSVLGGLPLHAGHVCPSCSSHRAFRTPGLKHGAIAAFPCVCTRLDFAREEASPLRRRLDSSP